MNELLKQLPQISTLLEAEQVKTLAERYSRAEVVGALRGRVQAARDALRAGAATTLPQFLSADVLEGVASDIEARRRASLRPVINATGVIIHTNLGRAPLAPEALQAIQDAAADYCNLEFDLETASRGSRHDHVERLICTLTGAEAAMVVNNCAAAVLTCLSSLAGDREVVASRGELIEIGGAFRLPEVIAQSGARLREVGATNRTTLSDYDLAINPQTAVLLKSHTSNFRIIGFTAAPSRRDLADLARARGLILMEDLGSGVLIDLAPYGLMDEPVVARVLHDGVDLVTFSGDKLLGGPQAGVIAGRRDLVDRVRNHPLARAVRIDKLSLAALEATLRLYLPPHDPTRSVPVLRMLAEGVGDVRERAERLARTLGEETRLQIEVAETTAYVGGGSLPQQGLASHAVALSATTLTPDQLAHRLRTANPAVVGRISDARLLLDMRTVRDADLADIAAAIRRALAP